LFAFIGNLNAKDTLSKKTFFIIKTDIGQPIISHYFYQYQKVGSLTLEVCLKRRHSVQVIGYGSEIKFSEYRHNSFQIIPVYKYFLSKKNPYTGFYTGAYIKGDRLNEIINRGSGIGYLEYNEYSLGGGLVIGYQNYIMKRIVVDVIFGCGVRQDLKIEVIRTDNMSLNQSGMKQPLLDGILALNVGYKLITY